MINFQSFSPWTLEKQDVALLTSFTVVLCFWLWYKMKSWNVRLPPGPPALPLIGNLHQLSTAMYRDFDRMGKKYGPLMHVRIGSIPVIVVQNAVYAREITKTHDLVFANRLRDTLSAKYLFHEGYQIAGAPLGDHWRYMRGLMTTEVLTPKRLMAFKDERRHLLFNVAQEMFEESKRGSPVRLKDHTIALLYNMVTKMISGRTMYGTASALSDEQRKFRDMVKEYLDCLTLFALQDWFPFTRRFGDLLGTERRMKGAADAMDQHVQSWLDDRRNATANGGSHGKEEHEDDAETKGDFVDTLLKIQGTDDKRCTDSDRKRMIETFLIGGTETSTTTVEWAMAELLKNPNLLKRVQDEIDAVVGRDRPVAEQDLSDMKLLNAVIRETFRLHPNGPYLIPRQGSADCKVGGYDIPSNARILISIWGLHRDEASWENPLEFIPERFLDQDRPLPFNGTDHAFMPFGSGRRHCPGINLGVLFVQQTLATLLHICDFSLPPGKLPEDIEFAEEPGVVLVMKNPVEMRVSPRLAPEFYKTQMAGTG